MQQNPYEPSKLVPDSESEDAPTSVGAFLIGIILVTLATAALIGFAVQ